ncbi:MAG: hypothetical protein IPJ01_12240 [Micavibrio sp.]|nr:hypothetical protein [Micavibrio sp.]
MKHKKIKSKPARKRAASSPFDLGEHTIDLGHTTLSAEQAVFLLGGDDAAGLKKVFGYWTNETERAIIETEISEIIKNASAQISDDTRSAVDITDDDKGRGVVISTYGEGEAVPVIEKAFADVAAFLRFETWRRPKTYTVTFKKKPGAKK